MAKILLVEDDASERTALTWLLEKDDHKVRSVHDARLALEILNKEEPFDIAIVDLGLYPSPSNPAVGVQFCRDLNTQAPDLPIIVITGMVSRKDLEERCVGIKNLRGFYPKPLDFMGIRQKVKEITHANRGET